MHSKLLTHSKKQSEPRFSWACQPTNTTPVNFFRKGWRSFSCTSTPPPTGALVSCSAYKRLSPELASGHFMIDPDGKGGQKPFPAFCDMRDKNGVGVTVIGHDREQRLSTRGCEPKGCFKRAVTYLASSLAQLAQLTIASGHCEQYVKYECRSALLLHNGNSWLESRDGPRMKYWGGAEPDSHKCACGMTNSCANKKRACNCDKNDFKWREDSGLLTHKPDLPVSRFRFGDVSSDGEAGFVTLGKLKCYGSQEVDVCADNPCKNGGTCKAEKKIAVCKCPSGFSGKFCEKGSFFFSLRH